MKRREMNYLGNRIREDRNLSELQWIIHNIEEVINRYVKELGCEGIVEVELDFSSNLKSYQLERRTARDLNDFLNLTTTLTSMHGT